MLDFSGLLFCKIGVYTPIYTPTRNEKGPEQVFSPVFRVFFLCLQSGNVLLHSVGTALSHIAGHMAVHVQRKGDGRMPQVF